MVSMVGWPRAGEASLREKGAAFRHSGPCGAQPECLNETSICRGRTPLAPGDITGRTSSEIVADLAPGAKIVKAFNTLGGPLVGVNLMFSERFVLHTIG
jgi:hypothetical protein